MAYTVTRKIGGNIGGGEGACKFERGIIHFDAAQATAEVPLAMNLCECMLFSNAVDADADQQISVTETILTDKSGFIVPADTGTATVTREVTTTALDVFYLALGR